MVTPRRSEQAGRQRIVYKDGKAIEGGVNKSLHGGRVVSNWHGGNLDPEAVARHKSQLSRVGFRDNAHAKGFF